MENLFVWTGLTSPSRRLIYTILLGGGLEYILKPEYAYTSDGEMRPWVVLSGNLTSATYIPAFMLPLIIGVMMSIFV